MLKFVVVFFLLGLAAASSLRTILEELEEIVELPDLVELEAWETWKLKYKKEYGTKGLLYSNEEVKRMNIWKENTAMIERHNQGFLRGQHTFTLKMNKFGDLTNKEFTSIMNGYKRPAGYKRTGAKYMMPANTPDPLPDTVDWRLNGSVTPVKDQGQCGSCWAFSATGALEAQRQRYTGELVSLSEQELIDCSVSYGTYGCDGGWTDLAFVYIENTGGIDTEESYPYTAEDGPTCNFKTDNIGATDYGFVAIEEGDEYALESAVARMGPVSIAIDASHNSFQFYSEGVYYEPKCGSRNRDLDHAVLAVGYGNDPDTHHDYWLVKNSWANTWGIEGYIKMRRNHNNMCGVATAASIPLV